MIGPAISSKLLQQIPVFRGLNESECRQIVEIACGEQFEPGQIVLRQGESGQTLWVVLEGRCEVVKHRDGGETAETIALAVLEPFSHFGEMSFFHPAPHSASVRAQSEVKLLKIARSDYDDLIRDGVTAAYKVAYNVLQSLADRLRRMDNWVTELASHQPRSKRKVAEWSDFRDKLFKDWNL